MVTADADIIKEFHTRTHLHTHTQTHLYMQTHSHTAGQPGRVAHSKLCLQLGGDLPKWSKPQNEIQRFRLSNCFHQHCSVLGPGALNFITAISKLKTANTNNNVQDRTDPGSGDVTSARIKGKFILRPHERVEQAASPGKLPGYPRFQVIVTLGDSWLNIWALKCIYNTYKTLML